MQAHAQVCTAQQAWVVRGFQPQRAARHAAQVCGLQRAPTFSSSCKNKKQVLVYLPALACKEHLHLLASA